MREAYLDYDFTHGTMDEVDFLVDLLQLPPGARILDVGCGPGRHSLELARRGFHPVGADISQGFIDVAKGRASDEGLNAEFLVADARDLRFDNEFDAAICLCEGGFGIAGGDEGNRRVLTSVARSLRPGAPFVLQAINALSVVRHLDGDADFDPRTCTSKWIETVRSPKGEARDVEFHCSAYTYRELTLLMEAAGFVVEAGYGAVAGDFQRKALSIDDVEIMMVARRFVEPKTT
ncbi:MAG: class I SAM-dependent methyltransferase [Chloroflexota bacterium]|nr:MAG: hypothetical protein DLM70_10210 [Chloroflexota bacterium]